MVVTLMILHMYSYFLIKSNEFYFHVREICTKKATSQKLRKITPIKNFHIFSIICIIYG